MRCSNSQSSLQLGSIRHSLSYARSCFTSNQNTLEWDPRSEFLNSKLFYTVSTLKQSKYCLLHLPRDICILQAHSSCLQVSLSLIVSDSGSLVPLSIPSPSLPPKGKQVWPSLCSWQKSWFSWTSVYRGNLQVVPPKSLQWC